MIDPIWLVGIAIAIVAALFVERRRRTRLTPKEHIEQAALRAEHDAHLSRGHGYIETDGPPGVGM